jgi:putative transposase
MGFIDTMRAEGHAVESVCRVLTEQGCQVAARTFRAWRARRAPAARTVSDPQVINAIKDTCWRRDQAGVLRLTRRGCTGGAS